MTMIWSRLSPIGDRKCASEHCPHSARWHAEAKCVGSDYCSDCRDRIDNAEIEMAAYAVVAFDWSDNDSDAVASIDRLRRALANTR